MSFRLKTILGIAFIESILLLILVFSTLNFIRDSNEESLLQHANTTSRLFASAIKDAVLSTDLATLESFIEEILTNPVIVYTRISSNGIILAEGGRADHPDILKQSHQPDRLLADVTDGIYDVRIDITEAGITYGIIEMGLSTSFIERLLADAQRWIIGIASLEIALVALFSFILGTYLTRQLYRLKKASNIIAEHGPGHQIEIVGNDEIADVGHAFNNMSLNLQQSYTELHSSLETQKRMVRTANQDQTELRLAARAFESSAAMFIADADANIIRTNSAFTRITGYESSEVQGKNPRIFSSGQHDNDFYKKMWSQLLEHGEWKGDIYNKRKNGEIFPEYLHITAVKDTDGRVTHYVAHLLDMSEQKDNEAQLRTAQQEAEAANEAKSHFLAAMSHEIRTPMNAVLGILGLLKDTPLNTKQRELVRTGRESSELLLTIINDILDFTKMEADKLQLEHTGFDLHKLLTSSINLLKHMADRKDLDLILFFEPDLPRYVKGDADRLRQILINLINNAIKFTASGSITVSASAKPGSDNALILCCAIKDTGIGIAKELQSSLFDEFTMVDQSYTRNYEGTGLGLAICKRLITLMHGSISVNSELGSGSTFVFTAELETADETDYLNEQALMTDNQPLLPAPNTRVLLAEDNPASQMVIKNILEFSDLHVDAVANGREAVDAVRSVPYDIVLMDISMPEMDGMTATREIRKLSGQESNIPIIALTAHSLTGDRERFIAAGMDDYLTKPIDKASILHCIAHWTNDSGQKQSPVTDIESSQADTTVSDNDYVDEIVLQQLARDTSADILPELLLFYIDDSRKRIEQIQQSITRSDFDTLEFESHTLGSSAAAHGNARLHVLARKVEHHCLDDQHELALEQAALLVSVANESFRLLAQRAERGFETSETGNHK